MTVTVNLTAPSAPVDEKVCPRCRRRFTRRPGQTDPSWAKLIYCREACGLAYRRANVAASPARKAPVVQEYRHDTTWRRRALCRPGSGVDPELFQPVSTCGEHYEQQVAEAKAVCARCPVRSACLAEALARIPHGILGGFTEEERRGMRPAGVTS